MKANILKVTLAVGALFSAAAVAAAAPVVLDFEGIGNDTSIGSFYNTDYGIVFSDNALALIDKDSGGTGEFGGEPSSSSIMYFTTGSSAWANIEVGFTNELSFHYTAINHPGVIKIWEGINGTGALLATLNLDLTPRNGAPDPSGIFSPLMPAGISFEGTAHSVEFAGVKNEIGFDDVTFGSKPVSVPDTTSSLFLLLPAIAGLLAFRRRQV